MNALTPTLSGVLTTTGGRTNLDFSNNNYGTTAAIFTDQGFNSFLNLNARLHGKLFVSAANAGNEIFSTRSDDGSMIWIDGNLVVNNNAGQSATTRTGNVTLTPGNHDIEIGYFQGTGGAGMLVQWNPNGAGLQTLSNSVLTDTPGLAIYGNDVSVSNNSAASTIVAPNAVAGLGNLTMAGTGTSGSPLTLAVNGVGVQFSTGASSASGVTLAGGYDVIAAGTGTVSILGAFTGSVVSLTSSGTGALDLESSGGTQLSGTGSVTSFGNVTMVGSGGNGPMGTNSLTLSGTANSLTLSSSDGNLVTFPGAVTFPANGTITATQAGQTGVSGTQAAPITVTLGSVAAGAAVNASGNNLTLNSKKNYILNLGGSVTNAAAVTINSGAVALSAGTSISASGGISVTGAEIIANADLDQSSPITLSNGAYVNLATAQSADNGGTLKSNLTLNIPNGSLLSGNLSNLDYTKVTFGANASIDPSTAAQPLTTDLTNGSVFRGLTTLTPNIHVGLTGATDHIYKGVYIGTVFTPYDANGTTTTLGGTITDDTTNGIAVQMNSRNLIVNSSTNLITSNATVGANFTSTGILTVNGFSATSGSTSLITRTGVPAVAGSTAAAASSTASTALTVNSTTGMLVGQYITGIGIAAGTTITAINGTTLTLSAAATVPSNAALTFNITGTTGTTVLTVGGVASGKTVDIRNGMFTLGSATAVAAGGTVNIDDQGSFRTDFYNGTTFQTFSFYPQTGTFNVLPGGVVYARGNFGGLNSGAFFNWSPGSKLVAYSETGGTVDTTISAFKAGTFTNGIAGNVDYNILWNNGIGFGGTNASGGGLPR